MWAGVHGFILGRWHSAMDDVGGQWSVANVSWRGLSQLLGNYETSTCPHRLFHAALLHACTCPPNFILRSSLLDEICTLQIVVFFLQIMQSHWCHVAHRMGES